MKLNYRRTFLVGLAFLSICAFWQMYDNVVPLILTNTFHLNETYSGAIMAADNILALFLLPLFGSLSDRHTTKIGKRMPFILFGTAAAVTRSGDRLHCHSGTSSDRHGNVPVAGGRADAGRDAQASPVESERGHQPDGSGRRNSVPWHRGGALPELEDSGSGARELPDPIRCSVCDYGGLGHSAFPYN